MPGSLFSRRIGYPHHLPAPLWVQGEDTLACGGGGEGEGPSADGTDHRLNMELDLQNLFGIHVHSCTHYHWLRPNKPQLPPAHLGSYTRALLVNQDRRHLFVTPPGRRIWYSRNTIILQRVKAGKSYDQKKGTVILCCLWLCQ